MSRFAMSKFATSGDRERAILEALERAEQGNKILRCIIANSYSGAALYKDDGELQDNQMQPFIDFKRDEPQAILDKMLERGMRALQAAVGTPSGGVPK